MHKIESILEDADEEESKQSRLPEKRRSSKASLSLGSGSSDEDGSSIDADDDEEKLYQQILA